MTMPTTDPEPIREALANKLHAVIPTLTWQQGARWTWHKDAGISGKLRSFDIIIEPEREVTVDERGVQGAYSGGIEYECEIELRVSYPVKEGERPRFLGADARDVTAILETLHESTPGMFAQTWSVADRVVSTWTGTPGAYVGSHRFSIRFFASDTVQVVS